MEIRIGIQNSNREIAFESKSTAADIEAVLNDALVNKSLATFTDDKGRRVLVPAEVIAYLEIGPEEQRRVGFVA